MNVQSVTFGGSMVRDVAALPGLLDAFVTASRRYTKGKFNKHQKAMSEAFSHVNAEAVVDDHGTQWEPGSLLHLGSDGKDHGKFVILVHKFIPIPRLYTPASFKFIDAGEPLQFAAPVGG